MLYVKSIASISAHRHRRRSGDAGHRGTVRRAAHLRRRSGPGGPATGVGAGWRRRCSPTTTSTTSSAPACSRPRPEPRAGRRRPSTATRPCRPTSAATSAPWAGTPPSTSASSACRWPAWEFPAEFRDPDVTYQERLTFRRGELDLRAAPRPGRDRRRHLDLDARATDPAPGRPVHLGHPQRRQPPEGAALRRGSGRPRCAQMAGLGAEVMLAGHGLPIFGADRIRQALLDTAEVLESIEAQTLALMNTGCTLDRALHEVEVPAHLRDRPVPAPGLRPPAVPGPQRVAAVRRLARRPARQPAARPAPPAGRGSGWRWPAVWVRSCAGPGSWPTPATCAWPATWSSTPSSPSPTRQRSTPLRAEIYARPGGGAGVVHGPQHPPPRRRLLRAGPPRPRRRHLTDRLDLPRHEVHPR